MVILRRVANFSTVRFVGGPWEKVSESMTRFKGVVVGVGKGG